MKKIVIVGTSVYGIENMGDEALLHVLVREIRNNIPECGITWIARHPNEELAKLYNIDHVITGLEHESKEASRGRWFNGLNPGDSTEHLKEITKTLEECDLLIIGGDPFSEITLSFYRGLAPYAALLITLAKFLQKPVMLYSIHMGRELKTPECQELTKFCITNSTVVTLREGFSLNVLKDMGINTDTCRVVADSAWALDPIWDKSLAEKILANESIQFSSDNIVGFNFRHQYWNWSKEKWSEYREVLINAANYITDELGAEVLFIPNCTYDLDEYYEDDRPVAKEILERMNNPKKGHLINNKYNLFETLSLFQLLKMHFSNRRHSLVFASVHNVPSVSCGGEWHIKPSMEEIGLGAFFVDIEKFDNQQINNNLIQVWNKRKSLSEEIMGSIPKLREKALKQGEIIAEIVKG